jgi:hypothetical protein
MNFKPKGTRFSYFSAENFNYTAPEYDGCKIYFIITTATIITAAHREQFHFLALRGRLGQRFQHHWFTQGRVVVRHLCDSTTVSFTVFCK